MLFAHLAVLRERATATNLRSLSSDRVDDKLLAFHLFRTDHSRNHLCKAHPCSPAELPRRLRGVTPRIANVSGAFCRFREERLAQLRGKENGNPPAKLTRDLPCCGCQALEDQRYVRARCFATYRKRHNPYRAGSVRDKHRPGQ